ncbi:MAG: hypothetical protein JW839_14785 [Candidatus Lokiarchaeota archaeon]|nr:hypothetical protein [Candidatus Lokiarchaeota archaeon]
MALIMVTGTYPPTKQKDLNKIYVAENKPAYPASVKKAHNWVAQVTNGLYKVYAVYKCPDDKVLEALAGLTKRYNFYAQVDGYKFSIELLAEAEEAIRMMAE